MVLFPNAKINLGLNIIEKRNDGFHNLETVFYPIQWTDALEVNALGSTPLTLNISGLDVNTSHNDNLCYKAWDLLAHDFSLPNLTTNVFFPTERSFSISRMLLRFNTAELKHPIVTAGISRR